MNASQISHEIRALANGTMTDNEDIFRLLEHHECLYLLSKIPAYRNKLAIQTLLNRAVIKQRFETCEGVFADLASLPYAVIKGAVLSSRIYDNSGYRLSGDIDLLVSPDHAEKVKAILERHGFVQGRVTGNTVTPYTRQEQIFQKAFTHQLAAFVKPTGKDLCPFVNIDVNTDLFWGESDRKADLNAFLEHREPCNVEGISVYRLEAVQELISLCLHHYKDFNSLYLLVDRGVKLSLFCDIFYYLLHVSPEPEALKQACDSIGVSEYVGFCIYHAQRIFQHEKLEIYSRLFSSYYQDSFLFRFGLCKDEYKYPGFGVSDLALEPSRRDDLIRLLTEEDWKKIDTNRTFM